MSGYAARFVPADALPGIARAVGEAGSELVARAEGDAALIVEVRRLGGELVVALRRRGDGTPLRRGLGARVLDAIADEVERTVSAEGAEIALTFRTPATPAFAARVASAAAPSRG